MTWVPNITCSTRATRAIAIAPARFTQSEIAQLAGLALTTISPVMKELERAGMVAVCRIGPRGTKIWRKTDKYRAPDKIKAANITGVRVPGQRRADEKELARRAAASRLTEIDAAMRGWRKEEACA